MKAFSILRYLRQFSLLILLGTLAGALGVYSLGTSRQTYTANTTIQYANDGASLGFTPNGAPIDVEEIYCAEVIARTIEDLGLRDMPDSLRSRCYVKPVIPDDQKTINEVLLEKGEAPAYFADTYTVYFVADSTKSPEFARNVLDAIISNYCEYYSEKYVAQRLMPNGTAELAGKEHDYIEGVEVLESVTLDMLGYLERKKADYPDFRASTTGYSYNDLYEMYSYFYNYGIPRLYAMILSGAQSSDVQVLTSRLQNEIKGYQLSIANRQAQIEALNQLIDNFSRRNKDMMDYHYQSSSSQTEYILKDVESRKASADQETTYDALLQEYVDLKTACEIDRIAMEHNQYLLGVFSAPDVARGQEDGEAIRQAMDSYIAGLNAYYALVDSTSRELNSALGARYLRTLSTVRVSSAVNVKLYMLLAIVLFAVIGCGGAVVLGRGVDFAEYLLYVDKLVGLPNRTRCDLYIQDNSNDLLEEDYTCLFIVFDSLHRYSERHGRTVGDEIMKDFAAMLENVGRVYGFVGYNGAGQFMAFFPDCPADKARAILTVLARKVQEYNEINPDREMEYSCGLANSTEDGMYELRDLLRLAVQRANRREEGLS